MRQVTRYFAGGNTAEGFYTCFSDIVPEPLRKRMFYIKGGPGVGKSSLMKRIGTAFEEAGQDVEYFHCSSDPDSLDGLSIPSLGVGMMDGTAPHVYDPIIPAARDTLISLGDFLDEPALRNHMGELRRLQQEISRCFARCYEYLGAAAKVCTAACHGEEDPRLITVLTAELCSEFLPLRGGRGTVRTLFSSAFTPKGMVGHLQTLPQDTTITLEVPFGQSADVLLRSLLETALSRGLDAVALRDPLQPKKLLHLALPAHSILFTTEALPNPAKSVPATAFLSLREFPEREQSFDRNAYELLLQRATEQLKTAKSLHDELESFYVSRMDFLRWEKVLDQLRHEFDI